MGELIDPDVWDSLVALEASGEPGFLALLLNEFLRTAPLRIRSLRAAEADGDARTLEWEAHSLKGSSGTLGLSKMVALCEQLEQAGHAGSCDGLAETLDTLEAEWGLVREALHARLPQLAAEPKAGSSD